MRHNFIVLVLAVPAAGDLDGAASGRKPSPRRCRDVDATLAPICPSIRLRVSDSFRLLGGKPGRLNDRRRELLADAIFRMEEYFAHRNPGYRQVAVMRAVRRRLHADLGWYDDPILPATSGTGGSHAA